MVKCKACKQHLKRETCVWLELNCTTGVYSEVGSVPELESQGCYPFGRTCAKNLGLSGLRLDLWFDEALTENGRI